MRGEGRRAPCPLGELDDGFSFAPPDSSLWGGGAGKVEGKTDLCDTYEVRPVGSMGQSVSASNRCSSVLGGRTAGSGRRLSIHVIMLCGCEVDSSGRSRISSVPREFARLEMVITDCVLSEVSDEMDVEVVDRTSCWCGGGDSPDRVDLVFTCGPARVSACFASGGSGEWAVLSEGGCKGACIAKRVSRTGWGCGGIVLQSGFVHLGVAVPLRAAEHQASLR